MGKFSNIKNKVEVHGDIALIHVNRKGYEHMVIVDREDLHTINDAVSNRLNIDSRGFVQHRRMVNGKWKVFQLHREIMLTLPEVKVGFANGNKLDLRKENLYYYV